jgi:ABC-2 type transport system permease protein
VRLYWEVARRGFRRYATYRAATVAGVFTNTIFGFMRAYMFVALFAVQSDVAGYDVSDGLTYTFATQGMIMVAYLWGWWDIALAIRSGDVVTDLSRPLDFQFYWLAQDLGRAAYHAIFRGIPPFVIGALFFHLNVPVNPLTWVAFILSIALATTVSFALRFMVNLSAFWLLDYRGVGRLAMAVWTFLSGLVVPVVFFPEPWRSITQALPFVAIVGLPVEVFLEKPGGLGTVAALTFQAAWAVALLAAGRWMLAAATRKVVIQGG